MKQVNAQNQFLGSTRLKYFNHYCDNLFLYINILSINSNHSRVTKKGKAKKGKTQSKTKKSTQLQETVDMNEVSDQDDEVVKTKNNLSPMIYFQLYDENDSSNIQYK